MDCGDGSGAALGTAGLTSPLVSATQWHQDVLFWFILKYMKTD